jgi:hypothetical protein
MADNYDPIPDLAAVLASVLADPGRVNGHAEAVAGHLGLGEDDSAETVAAELRKALGLRACLCGITPGAPSEVIPLACPVHGTPCGDCGGVESCKEDCHGE